ncbi:MAG: TonB-dependent receptor [Bryobacteraceae bacterium]
MLRLGKGSLVYGASNVAGQIFSPFANFLDDFGGAGSASRDFGDPAFYPELFRQAYFAQDRWQVTSGLTVTLGVRYEDFGSPMNSLRTPAYAGLFNIDTRTFTGPYSEPNKVKRDRNNFAPTVGITWSPSVTGGILGALLGNRKTVIRTGYNIGYDSFFNNIASNIAGSAPNLIATSLPSIPNAANPRGIANLSSRLPTSARAVLPIDAQNLVTPDLKNPYYQKWSFGVQRELPWGMVLDASYVGSSGTHLYINEDLNPLVPAALQQFPAGVAAANVPYAVQPRLDPLQGSRTIRTNGGHSSYHSGQFELNRRFSQGLFFKTAYTWSKLIDNASEVFTYNNTSSIAAIPSVFGGQQNERAISLYDRTHRLVFSHGYELPFFKSGRGFLSQTLGAWEIAGIVTFESGVPYSVSNGADADGLGGAGDRPDFNPSGRPGVRARPDNSSPTGFANPDAAGGAAPIDRSEARYIGLSANVGRTGNLGRNTERIPGIENWNANVSKPFASRNACACSSGLSSTTC